MGRRVPNPCRWYHISINSTPKHRLPFLGFDTPMFRRSSLHVGFRLAFLQSLLASLACISHTLERIGAPPVGNSSRNGGLSGGGGNFPMRTVRIRDLFGFRAVEDRSVAAGFDGGSAGSDACAFFLRASASDDRHERAACGPPRRSSRCASCRTWSGDAGSSAPDRFDQCGPNHGPGREHGRQNAGTV